VIITPGMQDVVANRDSIRISKSKEKTEKTIIKPIKPKAAEEMNT
jgi:hypothetical protein